MNKIRITKQFNFEMAHALKDYDGPCRNIHGHSYELFVTVTGEPINDKSSPKNGMLIDFGDLKKIVRNVIIDKLDHALILNRDIIPFLTGNFSENFSNIVFVDYQPTSENMLIDFSQKLQKELPGNIQLHCLKLRETVTSYAEWYASDNI